MLTSELAIGKESNMKVEIIRSLDELTKIYVKSKKYKEGITALQERLTFTPEGAVHKSCLKHDIGRCYMELQQHSQALAYAQESLELAELANDDRWKMNARVLMAQIHSKTQLMENAIAVYSSAHGLAKRLGEDGSAEIIFKAMEDLKVSMVDNVIVEAIQV